MKCLRVVVVAVVLLLVFPLPAAFIASAAIMFALTQFARYIPRRFGRDGRNDLEY